MGVSGSSLNDDVAIQQFTCSTAAANQLFSFTDITTITTSVNSRELMVVRENLKPAGLYVYPIPARSAATVELSGFKTADNVTLYLYTVSSGKLLMAHELGNNRKIYLRIDMLHLLPGVYLIKVSGGSQVLTQKMLILK